MAVGLWECPLPMQTLSGWTLTFFALPWAIFTNSNSLTIRRMGCPGALFIFSLPHHSSVLKFTAELFKSKVCNLWKRRRNRYLREFLTGHPNTETG